MTMGDMTPIALHMKLMSMLSGMQMRSGDPCECFSCKKYSNDIAEIAGLKICQLCRLNIRDAGKTCNYTFVKNYHAELSKLRTTLVMQIAHEIAARVKHVITLTSVHIRRCQYCACDSGNKRVRWVWPDVTRDKVICDEVICNACHCDIIATSMNVIRRCLLAGYIGGDIHADLRGYFSKYMFTVSSVK